MRTSFGLYLFEKSALSVMSQIVHIDLSCFPEETSNLGYQL